MAERGRRRALILLAWCLPIVLGLPGNLQRAAAQAPAREPTGLQVLAAVEDVLTDVIARAEPSVVAIVRVRRSEATELPTFPFDAFNRPRGMPGADADLPDDFVPTEFGTGVIIDAKGLILTNYHVVREDSQHYVTTHERKTYRAKIRAADLKSDLAVLELELPLQQPLKLKPITFGDASTLRKGQIVIALGNPYGIARDGQVSASWGIVSNLARKAGPDLQETDPNRRKRTLHHYGTLIQTDAKLNFGTSGGALLNLKGEMVGLTTSLAAVAGYEQAAGYAIPVNEAFRRILDQLRRGQEVDYGFLGIRMGRDRATGTQGLKVENVVAGTPAHLYGLRAEDIITHVNGRPIYDSDSLVLNVSSLPPETPVRLSVLRLGRPLQLAVQLAKGPTDKRIVTAPPQSWRGMRVDYPSAISLEFLSRNAQLLQDGGVAVAEVEPNSPAWQAGLRPEMIISHVGNTLVQTPKEFEAAVAGKNGPVQLHEVRMSSIHLQRDRFTYTVEPE